MLCASVLYIGCASPADAAGESGGALSADNISVRDENTYYYYNLKHKNAERPESGGKARIREFSVSDGAEASLENYKGRDNSLVWSNGIGSINVPVKAEKTGAYYLRLDYCMIPSESVSAPEFELYIDGQMPFGECAQITVPRAYRDETYISEEENNFKVDNRGNDVSPNPIEVCEWSSVYIRDDTGASRDPFAFFLTEGEHILHIVSLRDPIVIGGISFENPAVPADYSEYAKNRAGTEASSVILEKEAEKTYLKNDPTLYPVSNKSSAANTPLEPYATRLNTFGGASWSDPLQTVTWEFTVPKDGLYKIGYRFRQNYERGIYTSREVKIDGECLFSELKNVKFNYSGKWQLKILGDNEPYKFYLTAGKHTLTMTPTVSELCDDLTLIESTVKKLDAVYSSIIMITGTNPDMYRDYSLDETIPGLTDNMKSASETIKQVSLRLQKVAGNKGGMSATLDRVTEQLDGFVKNPDVIPQRVSNLQSNISALASWVLEMRNQSLLLDKIYIIGAKDEFPEVNASLAGTIKYSVESFLSSFTGDYTSIGNTYEKKDSVYIWLTGSRDEAGIVKTLIDSDFTEKTEIGVNANLTATSLLSAVMADKGPDVAISVAKSEPINLALRGAAEPLNELLGFDEILKDFSESALKPYMYRGKCYALPVTETFLMSFYRTDIFNKMGLEPPKTWTELYALAETLQRNNMNIGIPTDLFYTLLYQMGGTVYNDALTATALDSPIAYNAFKMWCEFYTQYGLPLFKNDYNRFRMGEQPLVIADYSFFNQLTATAPEIRNMWRMTEIPGTEDKDGNINTVSAATGTACILLKGCKNKENAWEFMKWYASGETQGKKAVQIESVLGVIARATPASRSAFKRIGWSNSEATALAKQWNNTRTTEEVPGSYYTTRNISNAFNEVYYNNSNMRQTLSKWNKEINNELSRKRKEFDYAE